jgi:hypothetical protein
MTPAWVETVTEAGLVIWSTWELAANAPENGPGQGADDAQAAVACARALRQPEGSGCFLTNDSIVSDEGAVSAYFEAAAPIIIDAGLVPGLYGQTVVYEWIRGFGYRYFWHAPDDTPPPYPLAQIVQTGAQESLSSGELVDVDEILVPDFGAWNADGLFPPAVPVPPKEPDLTPPDILPGQADVPGKLGPVRIWLAILGALDYPQGNLQRGEPVFSVPANSEPAIFGPGAQAATARFRVQHGVDEPPGVGAVGPKTWAAALRPPAN